MQAAKSISKQVGISRACSVMGVSRVTEHRTRHTKSPPANVLRREHPRALTPTERALVLTTLTNASFIDSAPAAVYAMLLEQGTRLCSTSTMYRLLRGHKAVRERRQMRRHPIYEAPQLLAQGPKKLWTWDITKLLGPGKFDYFHLHVMLDVFSRRVVGWMVTERESGTSASEFIRDCCARESVQPDTLTVHSDRGSAMMSKPVTCLLQTLDVHKSVSRPRVSNDNPFIEAHFKTMKYRPNFPKRFGCIQNVRDTLRPFFEWYNNEHRHSAIAYLTPNDVHFGRAPSLQLARQKVLDEAYAAHPERFVGGVPRPPQLPEAVWINPPRPEQEAATLERAANLGAEEVPTTHRSKAA